MQYTVVKQKRKTATIVINDQLEVLVKVPHYMTKKQIEYLVNKHEKWITESLEKRRSFSEKNDWYQTKRMLYLGDYWPVTLMQDPSQKSRAFFDGKRFIVISDGSEVAARQEMECFFRKKAKELLIPLANEYASLLEVTFNRVSVRKQATRWGSCSSKGNLSFNVKILCAPTEMISYVVLHEVMHLKHFNHSKTFWQEIEMMMPDYKRRMNYFKQFGQNFMI